MQKAAKIKQEKEKGFTKPPCGQSIHYGSTQITKKTEFSRWACEFVIDHTDQTVQRCKKRVDHQKKQERSTYLLEDIQNHISMNTGFEYFPAKNLALFLDAYFNAHSALLQERKKEIAECEKMLEARGKTRAQKAQKLELLEEEKQKLIRTLFPSIISRIPAGTDSVTQRKISAIQEEIDDIKNDNKKLKEQFEKLKRESMSEEIRFAHTYCETYHKFYSFTGNTQYFYDPARRVQFLNLSTGFCVN